MFITPLFFGAAHLHHLHDLVHYQRVSPARAAAQVREGQSLDKGGGGVSALHTTAASISSTALLVCSAARQGNGSRERCSTGQVGVGLCRDHGTLKLLAINCCTASYVMLHCDRYSVALPAMGAGWMDVLQSAGR